MSHLTRKGMLLFCSSAILLSACRKEGCTDVTATNYNEEAKKDDGTCVYDEGYTVPSTYSFTDVNGNSTVSFSGQTIRFEMLSEMVTYMKTGNTSGTVLSATQLKSMYNDNNGAGFSWSDVNALGMAASGKQLENKSASGDVIITALFKSYMDSIEVVSNSVVAGSQGVPGVVESNDQTSAYLQSGTGVEYTQIIEKGLMGAVFYNQISQVYLGNSKMNVDNTTAVDPGNGKFYTTMEHHWDEAYGYFTSATDYPTNGTDRFWGKYANSRENLLGSATKIADAFRTGRAAISNDDLPTRDAQIAIIRTELELVCAATAIHYLNAAFGNLTDDALRNHELSEAYAFIDALQYGENPSISNAQIATILSTIGSDFYSVSGANIISARDQLSSIFNLDTIKTQL